MAQANITHNGRAVGGSNSATQCRQTKVNVSVDSLYVSILILLSTLFYCFIFTLLIVFHSCGIRLILRLLKSVDSCIVFTPGHPPRLYQGELLE